MWQVNFTGRWIWIVNLWTGERHECLRKNNRPMKFFFHVAKTSIFPSNLEHEMRFFKVFPFNFWCMECCLKYTWCAIFLKFVHEIGSRPPLQYLSLPELGLWWVDSNQICSQVHVHWFHVILSQLQLHPHSPRLVTSNFCDMKQSQKMEPYLAPFLLQPRLYFISTCFLCFPILPFVQMPNEVLIVFSF